MLDSYATSSLQGGRTEGNNPSVLSGWSDNDRLHHTASPGSQSQSPVGSKQNEFYDRRYDVVTAVRGTMVHPDNSVLSTGIDTDDAEDDSPLISAIGMSSGELKQALYVSQEELSTVRETQSSLRISYRHLEPSIMELMQEHNHINAQVSVYTSSRNTPYINTLFNAPSNIYSMTHSVIHSRTYSLSSPLPSNIPNYHPITHH